MKLKITYTKRFSKHYLNLNNKEKELFKEKLDTFIKNPRHPSLRTKKIKARTVYGNSALIWILG